MKNPTGHKKALHEKITNKGEAAKNRTIYLSGNYTAKPVNFDYAKAVKSKQSFERL